ncbi:MAG: CHAT domain-containing protein, partial [Candidatus Eisenbacteria bacterium]|nr:CHAT domain-containing protein [Candidatus Eisenbacteria bacterium]
EELLAPVLEEVDQLPTGERISVWHLSGLVAERRGRRPEARLRLDRAIRALEEQRRLIPGVELRARAFEGHARVYRDRIDHALRSRRPSFDAIFALVESARARAFRDRGTGGAARARSASETESLRARLGSLVQRLERLQYESDREDSLRLVPPLRREIVGLERRIAAGMRRQVFRSEGSSEARVGFDPAGSDEIECRLEAGEVLVEYFMLSDRILALVLGEGGRRVVVLPTPPAAVRAAIQTFHSQLEILALTADRVAPNLPFLKRSADAMLERMYDALVRPLQLARASRLSVIPHGVLHQVPFECLRRDGGYLIDDVTIRRAPTADFLLRDGRTPAPASSRGGVLLSGMTDGGLAFVGAELDAVRAAIDDSDVKVLRNPTAEELLAACDNARWIHLSTHGVFREDNPLFSRLSTKGGALFLIDILERRLRAELVVLSACNSGQVFAGEGDDLSGVAHGFLASGASRLVASMWRVHDRATRDWMEHFYRALAATNGDRVGIDPGGALRRASTLTRADWDHPFYWGAFCLHG